MVSGSLVAAGVVCERLSAVHYSYQDFWFEIPWVSPLKYLRNVGLEYPLPMKIWSGIGTGMEYLPLENLARLRYFGLELVWSTPPPPQDLCCGSWYVETNRCIPKDTASFIRCDSDSDCDRRWRNHYVTLRSVGVYVVQYWQWLHFRMGNSFVAIFVGQCEWS